MMTIMMRSKDHSEKLTYNLEAAILRQISFSYQVARLHMGEDKFLEAAQQRYKGFLYLLKLIQWPHSIPGSHV